MDFTWRIELLGVFRAVQPGRELSRFKTRKTGSLLAYLACHLGTPVPREILIELFWPGRDPDAGRQNLSQALSSLRHQLEPPGCPRGLVLAADRESIGCDPTAVTTDRSDFERYLREAALEVGHTLVQHDPWSDEGHRAVVRLLAETGEGAAASAPSSSTTVSSPRTSPASPSSSPRPRRRTTP